ncbi:MAG: hypothetical protein HQ512_02835 [Rhodospirillales bacterium]|nr:hypothetical protein [Rhodospirillales bacterium]
MDFQTIKDTVAATGMIVRGGFHPGADEIKGQTLVLVGNAGPKMWQAFSDAVPADSRDQDPHPLDTWTKRVLEGVAADLGAGALYPFGGPPYQPFQSWAVRAGGVHPSPTGPLIDAEFGLWHAYRGALVFDTHIDLPEPPSHASPCESCADKPCLDACPTDAFDPKGSERADYDVKACVAHIADPAGRDCFTGGCLARRACPWGRDYVYGTEQATFHMKKFVANHLPPSSS